MDRRLDYWPPGVRGLALQRALAALAIRLRTIAAGEQQPIDGDVLLVAETTGPGAGERFWRVASTTRIQPWFLPPDSGVWLASAVAAARGLSPASVEGSSAQTASRMLYVVLHDVMKNRYLRDGRAGMMQLAQELPIWAAMWERCCGTGSDLIVRDVATAMQVVGQHLDGQATRDQVDWYVELLCANVLAAELR